MKNKVNVRFQGFTTDWEQQKFSELVNRVSNSSEEAGLPRIEFEDIIAGSGILNKDVFQKESIKRGIEFKSGDTLFGKLRPYLKNWLLPDFNGIAVGDFWVFRPKDVDSKFIYALMQSSKYQKTANLSTGTKMPRSDWGIVSNTVFKVPLNTEEQTKIGAFFEQLDKSIILQQQELTILKQTKQGFLQKMFPKEGESVPEVRFSGFANTWKESKLGDLVEIKSGWSPSGFTETNDVGGEMYIKVNDLNYSKREQIDSKMRVQFHDKYPLMRKGSIVFPKRGAAIMTNKVRLLGVDSYMDTNMMALEPIAADMGFLYTFIEKTGLFKIADTSTIPQINNAHIEPYRILLPVEEEQTKIGNFFKQLDETISLHQQELDLLKETKKGFLQKMFI